MKKSKLKHMSIVIISLLFCLLLCRQAGASSYFTADAKTQEDRTVTISITLNDYRVPIDGFEFYCAEEGQAQYQLIGESALAHPYHQPDTTAAPVDTTQGLPSSVLYDMDDDDDYDYEEPETVTFHDVIRHSPYRHCNYQIRAYQIQNGVRVVTQQQDISVMIEKEAPKITGHKRRGKSGGQLQWKQDSEADGYFIYCLKDNGSMYDARYQRERYEETGYQLVKTVSDNSIHSASFSHLKQGITYTYRVYSYKNINGQKVRSLSSEPEDIIMDYYSYASESYDSKVKRAFGSEKAWKKNYKKESLARKQMKTIKIKVWDFQNGKSGRKVTRIKYLTVNKNLAPSIEKMFEEIHKSKQKQVIHDIGSYSYRQGEHMYGLAIDINSNENYMIDGKKKLAGSFWKPKKNPYSIPAKCDLVTIMEKYGFSRGLWGSRRDYMHFSYFGG